MLSIDDAKLKGYIQAKWVICIVIKVNECSTWNPPFSIKEKVYSSYFS